MANSKTQARAWVRRQARRGSPAANRAGLIGLAGIGFAVAQAWCAAVILGRVLGGRIDHDSATLATGFAGCALARAALGALFERASFEAGAAARRDLRRETMTALLATGPSLLRRRSSGDLAALIVDGIESLDGLFARWLPAARLALAGPLLVLLAALWFDPAAGLILAACGLLVPIGMALSGIGAAAASRRQFEVLARLQARFLDRIRGIATIVMHGRADAEARAIATAAEELRRRTMRVLRVAFLSSVTLDLAAAAALVVIALRDASAILGHRAIDPANALFVLLLVPEFFAPLRAFSAAYQDQLHAQGAASGLAGLPSEPMPAGPAMAIRTVAAHGVSVAFEDVHFSWDETRRPALDGLSFRVPAGETLVMAGPSGAGKSTVMEILLGYVRPSSGRVTINGAPIETLTVQALARLTAWIGQRPVLFAGSLRENIRFGRPEATDEEVTAAAKFARIDSFASQLPEGLDTWLGEAGYGLSGGQAQRVAIARAFLKGAPLLLLDEPTAHLDPATEDEVLDSLRRLTVNRTVILASHSAAAHAFGGRRLDLRDGRAAPVRGVA